MRKNEQFMKVQVNKEGNTGKTGGFSGLFLVFLCLFAAEAGFALCFLSTFGVPCEMGTFYAGLAAIGLLCVMLYRIPRRRMRNLSLAGVAVLWGALGILSRNVLKCGALAAAEHILHQFNHYYNTAWVMDETANATALQNTAFLLYVMVPVTLILGAGMVRRFRWQPVAAVEILPFLGAMLVGLMPPVLPTFLAAGVLLAVISGKRAGAAGFRGTNAAFAMIGVALPAALTAALLLSPTNGFYEKNASAFLKMKEYFNQEIWPFFENLGDRLPFGGSGSSVDGSLARGELDFNGTKEMKVTIDYQPSEALYLRGFIGDEYTGRKWTEAGGNGFSSWAGENGWDKETAEEKAANLTYDMVRQMYGSAIPEGKVVLERVHASSRYAYLPYYTPVSDEYSIDGDGAVQGLFRDRSEVVCLRIPEDTVRSAYMDGPVRIQSEEDTRFLKEYREYVYSRYLEYPGEQLPRLVQQCQDNPRSDIWEIRDTVAATLNRMAIYDIHTKACPVGKDFTEYFLYEQKTGYCVHFATAAVLMFRIYGIPARYVTGYLAPVNTFFDNGDGTYTAELMDDMTHAWVEIYTDLGWIPVEVTPPYENAGQGPDAGDEMAMPVETPEATETEPAGETLTETPEAEEIPGENMSENTTQEPESGDSDQQQSMSGDGETAEPEDDGPSDRKEKTALQRMLLVLLWVLAVLVAALMIHKAVRTFIRSTRFNGSDYNRNVKNIYQYLYRALLFDRFPKEVRVSNGNFARYLVKCYPRIRLDEAEEFAQQVLRANYSSETQSRVENIRARNFYRKVCREISRQNGVIRRIQFRFLKGF